jgi:hypothetical protein
MKKCPICQNQVEEEETYCPQCHWEFTYYYVDLTKDEKLENARQAWQAPKIKTVASIALMVSFFLPLSYCRRIDGSINETYAFEEAYKAMVSVELFYFISIILAFTWPILFVLYYVYGKKNIIKMSLRFLEPFLCLGSFFVVLLLSSFGNLASGGYTALTSLISYFFSAMLEIDNWPIYIVRLVLFSGLLFIIVFAKEIFGS